MSNNKKSDDDNDGCNDNYDGNFDDNDFMDYYLINKRAKKFGHGHGIDVFPYSPSSKTHLYSVEQ